jgi:hypothetical protein
MKKIFFAAVLFISGMLSVSAQEYRTGLGFRFGAPTGFDVKYFMTKNTALDGTLGFWDYGTGFSITGLYEIHKSLNPKNFSFYYGAGAHIGVWDNHINHVHESFGGSFFGADGVLGIEYAIKEIPLCLSLDWNPRITFYSDGGAWPQFAYVGLTARYTMK